MKYFIVLMMFACGRSKIDGKALLAKKIDSTYILTKDIREISKRFDSAVYYYTRMIDCKIKRDSNEIAYLRTGDEKYFNRGNMFVDSGRQYNRHLRRVAK